MWPNPPLSPAGSTRGLQKLRGLLSQGAVYIPVDLVRRSADTLIADLNQGQFPDAEADDAVLLGVLEHVHDAAGLLRQCHGAAERLLLSYHPFDGGEREARRLEGWFNDYRLADLEKLLTGTGWKLTGQDEGAGTTLFRCTRR